MLVIVIENAPPRLRGRLAIWGFLKYERAYMWATYLEEFEK